MLETHFECALVRRECIRMVVKEHDTRRRKYQPNDHDGKPAPPASSIVFVSFQPPSAEELYRGGEALAHVRR